MGLFGDPWNPKVHAVPITADIRRTSIYNTSAVEAQTWNGTTVSARVVPDDTMYSASRADRPSLRPLRTGHAPLLRRFERGRQDRDRTRERVFSTATENGIKNFGKSVSGKAVWSAKKHYDDFVSVVGKKNAPESFEKYYELKYNKPEEYKKLRELYKGFSSGELVRNASGQTVRVVKHVKITGEEPNTITQRVNKNGGIDRNYYDENGRQYKQITNNGHGKNGTRFSEKTANTYTIMCMPITGNCFDRAEH